MALLAVFFAWPVGAMLARGLVPRTLETLGSPRTWDLVATTLRVAAAGTLGSVILGIPRVYAPYVCHFPGQRVLRVAASMPFVLPTIVVGVVFRSLLGKDGAYSFLELDETETVVIAAMAFFNLSVVVRTVGTMWAGLDPRSADTAWMLGAGPVRVFRTVTLPAIAPTIAGAASLVFLPCSTAYGTVMTPGGVSTLESEVWARTNWLNLDVAAGLSLVQLVIVALALVVSSRFSRSAALCMARRKRRLRLADAPVVALTAVMILALILVPMASLIAHSLVHADAWSLENCRQLATSGLGLTGGMTVTKALDNSLHVAVYATLMALAVGVPLAFTFSQPARTRRARLGQSLVKVFTMASLGVSPVTVGFDFPISPRGPPLELGSEAVPFAQAIVAVPMALCALPSVLRTIDLRLHEAVVTFGAGSARILRIVDLPLAARGSMLTTGFALAISLGEFGASSFLVSGESDIPPALISRLLDRSSAVDYGMTLAASVILGLLAALVILLCELPAGPDARMPAAEKTAEAMSTEKKSAESEVGESKTMARIEELK